MDYFGFVKRAYEITKKYRFIWWLGLLAMFAEGGAGGNFYNFNSAGLPADLFNTQTQEKSTQTPVPVLDEPSGVLAKNTGRVLGDSITVAEENFFQTATGIAVIGAIILIIILIALVIMYISHAAKAGLILSVQKLETENKELGFGGGFKAGKVFAWRLIGLKILIGLIILAYFAVVGVPIVLLALFAPWMVALVVGLVIGIPALVLLVPLFIYLGLIDLIGSREMVLKQKRIIASIKSAHRLLHQKLGPAVVVWLVSVLVGIVYSFAILVAVILIGGVLFLIGLMFYFIAEIAMIIYAIIAGLALFVALFIIAGIFTGFVSTYWTLAYLTLSKNTISAHN